VSDRGYRRAAEVLWEAWNASRPLVALEAEMRPRDIDEGYAIQRALDDMAGPAVGWKIAATSKAGQEHLGADGPMVGRLYEMQMRDSGSTLTVSTMRMRAAEPEFAFVFAEDLDPRPEGVSVADAIAAVGSLVLAIEVPDSRFIDFGAVGVPQLVADAMCGGHFILGPSVEGWRALDLPTQPARMLRSGVEESAGRGANVMGDPRDALAWMANEVLVRGWPLRAGDVVLTGASAPPIAVQADETLLACFDDLGTVEVRFVP
jgi:2-keto-4-pentenoate hydratase